MRVNKSLELWKRAIELIPRGTQTMSKAPDQFVRGVHPVYVVEGKGCKIKDIDGNWYIDYPCAQGPVILGYGNKRVAKAIAKQAKKSPLFSLMHPLEVELAELLTEIVPCAEQVRYAKNGTDADLACVRVARSYTGREHILKPAGNYHGWSDWHAASTPRDYGVPKCLKSLVETFPYNDLGACEEKLKTKKFAGLIMEPVSLEAPKKGFLEGIRELCTKYGTVLIFDEVITGFRWSLGGAQEYYGVTPDISAMGKAVANGMPLSIIAGKKEFMKEFDHIFFSSTFGGEACSLAAAVETVKILKAKREEIYSHIWEYGDRLCSEFNSMVSIRKLDVKMVGMGPRHNIVFGGNDAGGMKDLFNQEMIKNGVLTGSQLYINWSHKEKDFKKTILAMANAVRILEMATEHPNGVDAFLEGERSMGSFKKDITGENNE